MHENEISREILDTSIKIHSQLGPGLLESVYEEILAYELEKKGFRVERQKHIPLVWEQLAFPVAFRADLVVNEKVIIELKSVENLHPAHFKQVKTYLKITDLRLGLLINFGADRMVNGFHRVVNQLAE